MRKGHTDITLVLDRSGSMDLVREDTIGGFNQFLKEQKAVKGTADISLHQFDNVFETVIDNKSIQSAEPLTDKTFVPRGSTALLDAIGRAVINTGTRLEKNPAEKVVFVIITDGHENASREFSREKVFEMIKHQQDKYSWEFVFLGANQDAIDAAAGIGIHTANAMSTAANPIGTQAMYASASSNLRSYREGSKAKMDWSAEDKKKQKDAGATH